MRGMSIPHKELWSERLPNEKGEWEKGHYAGTFCLTLNWKPKRSISLKTVLKEGLPSGASALYKLLRSRFNSLAIWVMPFERAIWPIVLRRKSGSFSSRATSKCAMTSSLVSTTSAGSHFSGVTFLVAFMFVFCYYKLWGFLRLASILSYTDNGIKKW